MDSSADQSLFKGYLAFFAGQQVSLLGSSVVQFVVIWWVTITTKSAWFLGLASVAGFAPIVVLAPFAGVFVDRLNRKWVIGVVDLAQALSTVVLILFFMFGYASLAVVLLVLVFRGCCQAFHLPATEAIVPLMVPRDKLSRMNGLTFLFNGLVTFIGPLVAGVMLLFFSVEQALWIDPITFVVAVVPLFVIRIPSIREGLAKRSFVEDFYEGLSFVRSSRGLVPLVFLATALNFLLMPASTLLSYFVNVDHHGLEGDFALVAAVSQLGMLMGGLLMIAKSGFKRKMLATMLFILVCFAGYALAAFTPLGWFWFMAACFFLMSFAVAPANVLLRTILQTIVPAQMQGRVNSVLMSLAMAATPLGMMLSGALAAITGTANLFFATAVAGVFVVVGAWFLTDVRHVEGVKQELA